MGRGGIRVPVFFQAMNLDELAGRLQTLTKAQNGLQRIQRVTMQYVGFRAVLNKTISTINNALNNIKELDKTITNIAVVTNMSQEQLWGKMSQYMGMATQYGVAVNEVYTVSQLFYQQGLQTAQVMDMTNETLKMAKISGMDYAEAADAMTVAVRAFNIEMSNAQRVTDTYSALAANFAVSSQEIANAMEKTASSAASVGMSIESTSAFMSVMIQTTRESAQNIGSAMKSIISRYGEMKASPNDLLSVDGEEVSYNKVDTALKSIGISIKDAKGQFRDFDDVIMELAGKWKTLDNNTQRYIATVMAGNRQQSRFIALVSNVDELNRAMKTATDSQDASLLQVLKTMNSIESKAQQMKSAFTEIYASKGLEEGIKSFYDLATQILKNLKNQSLMSIAAIASQLTSLTGQLRNVSNTLNLAITGTYQITDTNGNVQTVRGTKHEMENNANRIDGTYKKNKAGIVGLTGAAGGLVLNLIGAAITAEGLTIEDKSTDIQETSKIRTGFGQGLSALGTFLSDVSNGIANGGLIGGIGGAITGVIKAAPNIISAFKNITDGFDYTVAEKYGHAIEETKKAQEEYIAARAKTKDLDSQIEKIKSLQDNMYSSEEALAEYHTAMNNLADTYPDLISAYDSSGNAIIVLADAEQKLLELRKEEANAAITLSKAEIQEKELKVQATQSAVNGQAFSNAIYNMGVSGQSGQSGVLRIVDEKGKLVDIIAATKYTVADGTKRYTDKDWEDLLKGKGIDYKNIPGDGIRISSNDKSKLYNDEGNITGGTFYLLSENESFNNLNKFIETFDKENESLISNGDIKSAKDWFTNKGIAEDTWKKYNPEERLAAINEYRDYILTGIEGDEQAVKKAYAEMAEAYGKSSLIKWYEDEKNKRKTGAEIIATNDYMSTMVQKEMLKSKPEEYNNLGEWMRQDEDSFISKSTENAKIMANQITGWLSSEEQIVDFLSDMENMSQFKSVEDLYNKYNIKYESDLQFTENLQEAWIEETLAARERLYSQIYGSDNIDTDVNGRVQAKIGTKNNEKLNENLFNDDIFKEFVASIDTWANVGGNGESPAFISSYVNLLSSQINSINKLYESGYKQMAVARLDTLQAIYNNLSGLDSEIQSALYSTISTIDYNDRSSIRNAIKEIEKYQANTETLDTKEKAALEKTIKNLNDALNNVVGTVIASYNLYMEEIAKMAKTQADRLSNASKGNNLADALTELNKLTTDEKYKHFTLDTLYTYDKNLGAYIYTQEGLAALMEKEGRELEIKQKDAETDKKIIDDIITEIGKQSNKESFIKKQVSEDLAYEKLYREYEDSLENREKANADGFIEYLNTQVEENNKLAAQAEAASKAFEADKPRQLVKSIKWEDLAEGKNVASNEALMSQLYESAYNTTNGFTVWWAEFLASTPEQMAEEYKKISAGSYDINVASSIISKRKNAITSAIKEILEGPNTILSETTIGILNANGQGNLVNAYGQLVIAEGENAIDAALTLLETIRDSLSLAEYLDQKRSIFASNASLAGKGIKGTLSAAELQSLGIDIKNSNGLVTSTAEGYKWTSKGAAYQYATLKEKSPMQASAFAATMANEAEYNNYAKILAKVRELTEELGKTNNEQVAKSLQEQLSLYKEIAGAIQETGKAFNFMSNNLPTGIQNVSDYFENAGQALTKFNEAIKNNKGEIAYKDFYNMMSHMQSQLQSSGLEGAKAQLEQVNKLMQLAAETAHNIDGTWSVNITKLCADIDIGTDDLGKSFTDSIHEMAKQQIEWIDAQIALLEGLSVLENVDLSGNGGSAFDSIKDYLKGSEGLAETEEDALADIKNLANRLNGMYASIKSIADKRGFEIGDIFNLDLNNLFENGQFVGNTDELKDYIDSMFDLLKQILGDDYQKFINEINSKDWTNATDSSGWNLDTLLERLFTTITTQSQSESSVTEEKEVGIKLKYKANGTAADLTINGKTYAWTEDDGNLGEFIQKSINDYNNNNPNTQISDSIEIEVSDVDAQGNAKVLGTISYDSLTKRPFVKFNKAFALSQERLNTLIQKWVNNGLLPETTQIEVKDVTVTNGDKSAIINGTISYSAGKVTWISASADLKGEGGEMSAQDVKNWALGKGISQNDITITESWDVPIAGQGTISVTVNYDAVSEEYTFGGRKVTKQLLGAIVKFKLRKLGLNLRDLVDGTSITAGQDGSLTLTLDEISTTTTQNISCGLTVTFDDGSDIEQNKAKVDEWKAAIGKITEIINTIKAMDTSGLEETISKSVSPSAIVTTKLTITIQDDGIRLVSSDNETGEEFSTFEKLIEKLQSIYNLPAEEKVAEETSSENEDTDSNKKPDYDATKGITVATGLNVTIKDNGIQLFGDTEGLSTPDTIDELFDQLTNQYQIESNLDIKETFNGTISSEEALNKSKQIYELIENLWNNYAQRVKWEDMVGDYFDSKLYPLSRANRTGSEIEIAEIFKQIIINNPSLNPTDVQLLNAFSTQEDVHTLFDLLLPYFYNGILANDQEYQAQFAKDYNSILENPDLLSKYKQYLPTPSQGSSSSSGSSGSIASPQAENEAERQTAEATTKTNEAVSGILEGVKEVAANTIQHGDKALANATIGELVEGFNGLQVHADMLVKGGGTWLGGNGKKENGFVHLNTSDMAIFQDLTKSPEEAAGIISEIWRVIKDEGSQSTTALADAFADGTKSVEDFQAKLTAAFANQDYTIKVNFDLPSRSLTFDAVSNTPSNAKGNVALAKGTLMGELGPEMVVSNGHYFLAGENGAEFVDLPEDAIVFNHLQTENLMKHGHGGRGKAVNGVKSALAKGNANGGPAMAGADSAIAQLKQLRAMWQNLLNQTGSDLAKKSGSGGGGNDIKAVLADLQRWYNLLRQIDKVEKDITLEQKKRNLMTSGNDQIKSMRSELAMLEKEQKLYETLGAAQKDYYDVLERNLNASAYSMFYTYDQGLLQYNDKNYKILEELYKTDENGKALYNADKQIEILKKAGFDISTLQYNSEGEKSKTSEDMMNVFKDEFDGQQEEIDKIYDSYRDYSEKSLSAQEEQNKLLEEFKQIEIDTENLIMQAVEDKAQAAIDELKEQSDTINDASSKYINGLRDALDKERKMYDSERNKQELTQLQRQLAILQRSGGSASAIKALQDQIDNQLQEQYFTDREEQISAIEEASNKQIEKLQEQIDLMTETLEYQKDNGLLWNDVDQILRSGSPEAISAFISEFSKEYASMSATSLEQEMNANIKKIEAYIALMADKEIQQNFNDWYKSSNLKSTISKLNGGAEQWKAYGGDAGVEAIAKAEYMRVINEESYGKTPEELEKYAQQKAIDKVYSTLQLDKVYGVGSAPTISTGGTGSGSGSKYNNGDYYWYTPDGVNVRFALRDYADKNKQKDTYIWERDSSPAPSAENLKNPKPEPEAEEAPKPNEEVIPKPENLQEVAEKIDTAVEEANSVQGNSLLEWWNEFWKNVAQGTTPFSHGGDVDYTGLAMVHGSKQRPEAFVSAEDREMMKSSIFSKDSHTVVKAMEQFLSFAEKLSTNYNNDATNNMGMSIENVNINLDSGVIANDYDARRAAQTVMDEITKIARQTTNLSLSRR